MSALSSPRAMRNSLGEKPPTWWMEGGYSVKIKESRPLAGMVILAGRYCELVIRRESIQAYRVDWEIEHVDGKVRGDIKMTKDDLVCAFGLKSSLGEGPFVLSNFVGDAGVQGKFFRSGKYLNIPHPGTGLRGDPNISLEITGEIMTAIMALIIA